jgi:hypothetical protein
MHRQALCANCGIAIAWQATVVDGKAYCCLGCAQGGPCVCDYDNLPQAEDVKAMILRLAGSPEAEG